MSEILSDLGKNLILICNFKILVIMQYSINKALKRKTNLKIMKASYYAVAVTEKNSFALNYDLR